MYLDRRGRSRYLYSTYEPQPQGIGALIITILFFVPFVVVGLVILLAAILQLQPPKPLVPEYEENGIHISDKADLLSDEKSLERILNEFEDLTGICPYIMTVYDSDWEDNYDTLEAYSYSLYVNSFPDEQHFLIVYSEPENAEESDFVNWRWEAMQGDDTDRIITEGSFAVFQEDLQKNLTIDAVSLDDAFNKAFSSSLGYIMKSKVDASFLAYPFFILMWNGIVFYCIYRAIQAFIVSKRTYMEVTGDNQGDAELLMQADSMSGTYTSADKDSWDL